MLYIGNTVEDLRILCKSSLKFKVFISVSLALITDILNRVLQGRIFLESDFFIETCLLDKTIQ